MGIKAGNSKKSLFETVPVSKALATLAGPTIVSQLINLIYNMADAFFLGRTGNSYMIAATTLTLTIFMMTIAISNLFGIGGGSLMARLAGQGRLDDAKRASAYSFYGAIAAALLYSLLIGVFLTPVLRFLGASDATLGYCRSYTLIVIVTGSLPVILSMALAHLLRNVGYSVQASIGLSGGGVLNIILDPVFMFVILPHGYEVVGAALATLVSYIISCSYLLYAFRKASKTASISMSLKDARMLGKRERSELYRVGVPSAVLTGLFDAANIIANMIAAAHGDLVLAGLGIVMKVERVPNAVCIGICQGMIPLVAYNYSSGNRERMNLTIKTARIWGLSIAFASIVLLELAAKPVSQIFLSTSAGNAEESLMTIGYAVLLLRIRCLASPVQFLNYSSSFGMQAMGNGRGTFIHAVVREFVFYVPMMFVFDRLFSVPGLGAALPVGEACGAVFALWLMKRFLEKTAGNDAAK